jgi:peptide/nickel transport system permease protein
MVAFIAKKIAYGLLVLYGVVTLVFFLFNLSPADPVRNLLGENAPAQVVDNMRRKLDLDVPLFQRYLLYLNDLSPLSVHNRVDVSSRIFLDSEKYTSLNLFPLGDERMVVLKAPYLKRSFLTDRNVSSILAEAMPGTVVLAFASIALALMLGLWMGAVAATHKDSGYDRAMLFVSALGMAGPSFFVAILVAWLGAVVWREHIHLPVWLLLAAVATAVVWKFSKNKKRDGWITMLVLIAVLMVVPSSFLQYGFNLPGTGLNMTGSLYAVDVWNGKYLALHNLILPVLTLMVRPLSVIVQLTRSSLLDVLSQDYIRTARAKGLPEKVVLWKHAMRNALNPVITAVSGWFASLLAGAVFVEFVFGWKGLGQEMFTAIEKQDLPVVMGGVLMIAAIFVLINIFVDLLYAWIDPRISTAG